MQVKSDGMPPVSLDQALRPKACDGLPRLTATFTWTRIRSTFRPRLGDERAGAAELAQRGPAGRRASGWRSVERESTCTEGGGNGEDLAVRRVHGEVSVRDAWRERGGRLA